MDPIDGSERLASLLFGHVSSLRWTCWEKWVDFNFWGDLCGEWSKVVHKGKKGADRRKICGAFDSNVRSCPYTGVSSLLGALGGLMGTLFV